MKAPQHNEQQHSDHDVSNDPVWDLLRQSPAVKASPDFADRVIQSTRTAERPSSFWAHSYTVIAGLGAIAAALTIAAVMIFLPEPAETIVAQPAEPEDAFATLDEVAHQEMLLAATDHLGEFSDTELVTLIGF
jgi:hypothetical protein